MGRLQGITVDIYGASTWMDFEVIEIMDESSPYAMLLGINWAIDMNGVIDLKQRKMIFKKKSIHVVIPLDPTNKPHYTEPMCNEEKDNPLDYIYKIAANRPKEEGRLLQGYAGVALKLKIASS